MEHAILKFINKWGEIIKYDSALSWIALGLAEWFPPIPKTPWVLVGRDSSENNSSIKNVLTDYSNYIDSIPGLNEFLEDLINDKYDIINLSFYDVYERLVLVLLHCPPPKRNHDLKSFKASSQLDNDKILNTLPLHGGLIEERVTLFIYLFRKLLPELSSYFSEEQILNKFGSNDDEWLIWWLKYCGSKVWSRLDRGRIWDLLLGYKIRNKSRNYKEVLHLRQDLVQKLGADNFWSINNTNNDNDEVFPSKFGERSSSFSDLIKNLSIRNDVTSSDKNNDDGIIPFPSVDPHIQLLFITISLMKSKENTLIELDQHEIRQYLSRLPTTSYNLTNKYQIFKQKIDRKREEEAISRSSRSSTVNSTSPTLKSNLSSSPIDNNSNYNISSNASSIPGSTINPPPPPPPPQQQQPSSNSRTIHSNIISNDSSDNHSIDFMDNIINEAGELWRKWIWVETGDED